MEKSQYNIRLEFASFEKSWMWKSQFQYFLFIDILVVVLLQLCSYVLSASINAFLIDPKPAALGLVFPFPPLHFPSLFSPCQRLYQESRWVDKALARVSRIIVSVGKTISIWFKIFVLLVIFKVI